MLLLGLLCDLLWYVENYVCHYFRKRVCFRSDPDKETQGWGENDRGVSFTFGADVVAKVGTIECTNSPESSFSF